MARSLGFGVLHSGQFGLYGLEEAVCITGDYEYNV